MGLHIDASRSPLERVGGLAHQLVNNEVYWADIAYESGTLPGIQGEGLDLTYRLSMGNIIAIAHQ